MAYNPYYPYTYQTQMQAQLPQQMQPQQNNSFISARSMEEAYNWPVAPGNSLTFKIENTPYVCTKTKGFSPLDQPVFEKYRLVKEEEETISPEKKQINQTEIPDYQDQINEIWNEINAIKGRLKGREKRDKSADDNASKAVSE